MLFGVNDDPALVERLRQTQGVRYATIGGHPLMGTWTPPIFVSGPQGKVSSRTLGSGAGELYFETLGIPLIAGRTFTRQETERHAPVAVISESTAAQFWPNSSPLGQRFTLDLNFNGDLADFEVIGIVKDVRYANLTRPDPAHVYLPLRSQQTNNGILVRVEGDPQRALAGIRSTVEAFDRKLAPGLTLVSIAEGPLRLQRLMSSTAAMFALILAGLAMALASVGIYGVMAYLVSQRVKEIGIRMALGASSGSVLRAVILAGLRPVTIGLAIGFILAAGASYLLHTSLAFPGASDMFYGVPFYDPATFLGFAAVVAATAAIASAVPARRAVTVDPMVALRHE
jgi:hypothetical protein